MHIYRPILATAFLLATAATAACDGADGDESAATIEVTVIGRVCLGDDIPDEQDECAGIRLQGVDISVENHGTILWSGTTDDSGFAQGTVEASGEVKVLASSAFLGPEPLEHTATVQAGGALSVTFGARPLLVEPVAPAG